MSLRFRKRVKVLPGIYLNIGKNGVSTTIGPRGASVNFGKGGAYLNTGIPGTGISNRQKLFGGNSNNPTQQVATLKCDIRRATIEVFTLEGADITSEVEIRNQDGNVVINFKSLPKGCYVVKTVSGNTTVVKKIILE